jgi:hypothetical protein
MDMKNHKTISMRRAAGRKPRKNVDALPLRKPTFAEQEAAKMRGEMVLAADVASEWSAVLPTVRTGFLAVPSRCAARSPHLSKHYVAEIDAEARAALTRMSAVAIVCLALCGCDDDKNRAFQACNLKAHADALQTEICMDEQGYVFSTSHLCSASYPKVGAECYSTTWRAWDGGGLRCLNPDNSKCGPLSKPYLKITK